ncbi:hypothetical protein A5761_27025 [Mycolicibacterium setense]|uniref:LLM class flavin-dependent oxidoreductase n=1 Tax=Mycolicibacterium setense TaxID=431269 RepID=UPI0007EBBA7C|nr:LLM class flavin-dependent oxidoreductase [Mycolicibacterium setense]OBB10450.1 hypothetical protein A5761_27025 [Mycolicibacterium setense]
MAPRREYLNLVLFDRPSGWTDKQQAHGSTPASAFSRIVEFAQQAERAKIDAFFKADFLGFDKDNIINDPSLLGEPLAVSAALASVTERIGLVVTASTSFFEPYNVARQIATLHNVSGGRAGWNAVTSFNGEVNFGPNTLRPPAERYARAAEFIEVVIKLWNSWDPDALSFNDGHAPTVDSARIRNIGHAGTYYSVEQAHFLQRIRGSGHLDVIGTPEQVADVFAEWFTVRASDGFTLHGGNSFDRLTDQVLPLLRDKGLVRQEYEAETLRGNLGL